MLPSIVFEAFEWRQAARQLFGLDPVQDCVMAAGDVVELLLQPSPKPFVTTEPSGASQSFALTRGLALGGSP